MKALKKQPDFPLGEAWDEQCCCLNAGACVCGGSYRGSLSFPLEKGGGKTSRDHVKSLTDGLEGHLGTSSCLNAEKYVCNLY